MTFLSPMLLLTLLVVPLLAALYLRALRRRAQAHRELGALGVEAANVFARQRLKRHVPPGLMLLGLSVLLIASARPMGTIDLPRIEGSVVLAMDVSRSMLAEDLEPNRLDAARSAARAFVEAQPATVRIGLVAFSAGGMILQRPTDDRQAILDALDRLSAQGATSLGEGMFAALNALSEEPLAIDPATLDAAGLPPEMADIPAAAVLLMTDGENTDSPDPLLVAQLAAESGVRIYPIGIGSPEGTVLEVDGFQILTQLNEAELIEIAEITQGEYWPAAQTEDLEAVYRQLDLRMTTRGEQREATAVFAGASLLLLLLGGGLALAWFGRAP